MKTFIIEIAMVLSIVTPLMLLTGQMMDYSYLHNKGDDVRIHLFQCQVNLGDGWQQCSPVVEVEYQREKSGA